MHIQDTGAAIKRFEALGDENATIEDWQGGMLTDTAFIAAAEQTFCQRHDYPNRRYSVNLKGPHVDLPECTCPEPKLNEVIVTRETLENLIQRNQTSPGWETRLNLNTGKFISVGPAGERYPTVNREDILVPIPCMEPEGSGRTDDRFEEFCAEYRPSAVPLFNEYVEETGGGKLSYLEAMESAGWDDAVDGWRAWEAEHLDWLIDKFVEGAAIGEYESGDGMLDGYTMSGEADPWPAVTLTIVETTYA